jgi:uncharacterized protein
VLRSKFAVPVTTIGEVEAFLRGYHVEPKPHELPYLKLKDRNDVLMVASAINSNAAVLITGDQEILALKKKPQGLLVENPREFWNLAAGKRKIRRK